MNFDSLLYRDIIVDSPFEGYLPETNCQKTALGSGNTIFSVEMMAKMVNDYNHQTQEIAMELQEDNLSNTIARIHCFIYNHFQYKADAEAQMLRSPACAWKQRFEGIDCKTYSIIASCLLTNLDLKHYIRQIKQPDFNSSDFTHVYIIVPINQTTGKLTDGYFIIDGTLKNNIEPAFIAKKDFFMNLPHYGLNGYRPDQPTQPKNPFAKKEHSPIKRAMQKQGLHGTENESTTEEDKIDPETEQQAAASAAAGFPIPPELLQKIKNFQNKIKNIDLKQHFSCWGGSAIDTNKTKEHAQKITAVYAEWISELNKAIASDNLDAIGHYATRLNTVSFLLHNTLVWRRDNENWSSRCTKDNLTWAAHFNALWRSIVTRLLEAHLSKFYSFTVAESNQNANSIGSLTNNEYQTIHSLPVTLLGDAPIGIDAPKRTITIQSRNTKKVMAFDITPVMEQFLADRNEPDTYAAIQGLNQVIFDEDKYDAYVEQLEAQSNPTDTGGSNNPTNTGGSNNPTNTGGSNNLPTNTTTQSMSAGWVLGGILGGFFLTNLFKKSN